MTNNVIANNVAGWDGGGVSIQDAFKVTFVNNTVASNDTTASAGVLFKTLGGHRRGHAAAGLHAHHRSHVAAEPELHGQQRAAWPAARRLGGDGQHSQHDRGLGAGESGVKYRSLSGAALGTAGARAPDLSNADCRRLSKPKMMNDLFWQNRAFSVQIIGAGTGTQSQQNLVALTPQLNQGSTGDCSTGAASLPSSFFWDIGMRTDDFGNRHSGGHQVGGDQFHLHQGHAGRNHAECHQLSGWCLVHRRAVLQWRPRTAGELRFANRPDHAGELQGLQHAGGRIRNHRLDAGVPVQRHPADCDGGRGPQLVESRVRSADLEQAECRRAPPTRK